MTTPGITLTVVEGASAIVGERGKTIEALGVQTLGTVFTPIIEAGTRVPCSRTELFSTAEDNQDQITITLFRGRSTRVDDAHLLGSYQIHGIRPAKRGKVMVEVTFAVSADHDILLAAVEQATGQPMPIRRLEAPPGDQGG